MSVEASGPGCTSLLWLRGGFALHLLVMDVQLVEPAYGRIFKIWEGKGNPAEICIFKYVQGRQGATALS